MQRSEWEKFEKFSILFSRKSISSILYEQWTFVIHCSYVCNTSGELIERRLQKRSSDILDSQWLESFSLFISTLLIERNWFLVHITNIVMIGGVISRIILKSCCWMDECKVRFYTYGWKHFMWFKRRLFIEQTSKMSNLLSRFNLLQWFDVLL